MESTEPIKSTFPIINDTQIMQDSKCQCIYTSSIILSIVFLYIILFRFKNPFQFYIKLGTYLLIVFFYAIFLTPFSALRPNNSRNVAWFASGMVFICSIFKLKVKLENEKYLHLNGPYILIINHQSALDLLTLCAIWPGGNLSPLAKKELLYTGPVGLGMWLCGITFIERFNSEKARNTIDKLAKRINDEKLSVWIYPEGSRSMTTKMLPFKKGAFHLAIRAQVPIVCVVTSSYLNFYDYENKKFDFDGEIKVRVLPPYETKGLTIESINYVISELQGRMQNEFDILNKEINLDKKFYSQQTNGTNKNE